MRRTRVLFVSAGQGAREEAAALAWVRTQRDYAVTQATAAAVALTAIAGADVVWLHAAEETPNLDPAALRALRAHLEGGGGVLLTLLATPLVVPLGLERLPPTDCGVRVWRDDVDPLWPAAFRDWPDYPHVRGLQAWGAHPLFEGFVRGAFTWRASEGERVPGATYVLPQWPVRGRVVAVERAYVQLEARRAAAWEYALGGGRLLCVGAHLHFAAADASLAAHRDRVVRNAIALVARTRPGASVWWPNPMVAPPPLDHADFPAVALGGGVADVASDLSLTSLARVDDPFTLAGRRALVVGGERSGVREVWIHPLCAAADVDVRIDGEEPNVRSVEISPGQVVRHLYTRARAVEERVFVPSDDAAAILEYRHSGATGSAASGPAPKIEVRLRLPLRLQWPVPADTLRPLRLARREGEHAVSVAAVGRDEHFIALVNVEGVVSVRAVDDEAAPLVAIAASLDERLRVTVAASALGRAALGRTLRVVGQAEVPGLAARSAAAAASLRRDHVALRSASATLDAALEWAKVRLRSFVATAPGVGTGVMAGYSASKSGWGESRPGYAWFFGRDACWTGFALLGAGMFGDAKLALDFLARTQDLTGKIAHEVTTSGAAHYDAADATPLFLRLAAAYVDWTGDVAGARALWPAVRRALRSVRSTDRDGDGLPENTHVGHGWIESGPLGGGSLTSYVAAVWINALDALHPVARAVGDHETADACARQAAVARRAFRERLYDAPLGRHALHRMPDGTLVSDVTALAAVPIALGLVDAPTAGAVLDVLAGEEFSAPWGVRMLSAGDSRYDPSGYHSGVVWPLYTGWVALAEYAAHRGEGAYRHLVANALLCYDRAKGAFDEALRGDEPTPAGVCPDQAWSAAMVVSPLVTGMLGVRPDAVHKRVHITPHWPGEWEDAQVHQLRVGDAVLELAMTRGCLVDGVRREGWDYRVRCVPSGALTVVLEQPTGGREVERVTIDGADVATERCGTADCPHLRVSVWLGSPREVRFVGPAVNGEGLPARR